LLKKDKINIETIDIIKDNFILKFLGKLFFPKPKYFFGSSMAEINLKKSLIKYHPTCIFNFYNLPMAMTCDYNISKKYGYFNIAPHTTEFVRQKNCLSEITIKNILIFIYSHIFSWRVKKIYTRIFSGYRFAFLASPDHRSFHNKFNKIIIRFNNFSVDKFIKNEKTKVITKTKKKIFILVGNLNATFTKEGLYELSDNLIKHIAELRKKYEFEIRIIGHHSPTKKIRNKLNYNWVKFVGWIKDLKKEYTNATALLVPNKSLCGTRMRILNSMAAGVPVITFNNNTKFNKEFKDSYNILSAKTDANFIESMRKVLVNKNLRSKISRNGKNTVKKYYNPEKIAEDMINCIIKDYSS
jgi:glycosyltransferase involved in cell wall biosynthesis